MEILISYHISTKPQDAGIDLFFGTLMSKIKITFDFDPV